MFEVGATSGSRREVEMAIVDSLGPSRIYRTTIQRRRLALATVVALGILAGPAVTDALGSGGQQPNTVTVHAGDTLWSIAVASGSGDDVRQEVDDISAANHLRDQVVVPGQVLVLPGR